MVDWSINQGLERKFIGEKRQLRERTGKETVNIRFSYLSLTHWKKIFSSESDGRSKIIDSLDCHERLDWPDSLDCPDSFDCPDGLDCPNTFRWP